MPKEQDPIRDALKQISDTLNAPNPLEVLGVTPELARELQPDALQVAVKGLYRAFQSQLHPDRATVSDVQSDRLRRIQEAYDDITDGDIGSIRDQYIRPARRGRSRSPSAAERARVKDLQFGRAVKADQERSVQKSSDYIDGLMSDESIRRIKRGFALIRPISLLKQDNTLPMQSLSIDGGHVFLDNLVRTDEIAIPSYLAIPKGCTRSEFYIENGRALVRDSDGKLRWQGVNLPDGWHVVHGKSGNRSMSSYLLPSHRTSFEMDLAGCIEEDAVKQQMKKFFAGSSSAHMQMELLGQASEGAAVPTSFRNRFLLTNGWRDYTLNGLAVNGHLVPKLIDGQVLTARAGEEHLLVLGKVEQSMTHFMG